MVETAAHLVDHVLPHRPVRQWVLSFPYPLRFLLASQAQAMGKVLAIVNRAISTYLINKAGFKVFRGSYRCGDIDPALWLGTE